jgi:hypothetical protein
MVITLDVAIVVGGVLLSIRTHDRFVQLVDETIGEGFITSGTGPRPVYRKPSQDASAAHTLQARSNDDSVGSNSVTDDDRPTRPAVSGNQDTTEECANNRAAHAVVDGSSSAATVTSSLPAVWYRPTPFDVEYSLDSENQTSYDRRTSSASNVTTSHAVAQVYEVLLVTDWFNGRLRSGCSGSGSVADATITSANTAPSTVDRLSGNNFLTDIRRSTENTVRMQCRGARRPASHW